MPQIGDRRIMGEFFTEEPPKDLAEGKIKTVGLFETKVECNDLLNEHEARKMRETHN